MKLIWELFLTFFKIGAFTFGGGLAMLPVIRKTVIDDKGWLTEEEITDCFALAQSLPGVLAVNTAIYVGNKKKDLIGSIAAALGVTLPSFICILTILLFLGRVEDNPYVQGALEGIKAAIPALILVAAYKMGRLILKTRLNCFIAAVSFAVIIFAGISAVWAIVFGGAAGFASYLYRRRKGGSI